MKACRKEYEHLRRILGTDAEVYKALQHQFAVVHQRNQAVFALGALGITVTGFSGHRMVAAGPLSGIPLVIGLCIILGALFTAMYGVGQLQWISSLEGDDVPSSICNMIRVRNRKAKLYRRSVRTLLLGLSFYVMGICNYLIQASHGKIPLL